MSFVCAHIAMGNPRGCTNLLTNLLPDDSRHFISVEFNHWVRHGDFRLYAWRKISSGDRGEEFEVTRLTVPNHCGRKTSLS